MSVFKRSDTPVGGGMVVKDADPAYRTSTKGKKSVFRRQKMARLKKRRGKESASETHTTTASKSDGEGTEYKRRMKRGRAPGKSGSHVSDTGSEKRSKGIRNAMKRKRIARRRQARKSRTSTRPRLATRMTY